MSMSITFFIVNIIGSTRFGNYIFRIAPQLTFRSGKDVTREINLSNEEHLGRKQILISYVRAEAAKHALQLKRALTEAGFGVFLVKLAPILN